MDGMPQTQGAVLWRCPWMDGMVISALAEENAGSSFVAMFLRNSEHFLDSFWAVSPGATFYNCSRVDIND
jgi:hypothetical protein